MDELDAQLLGLLLIDARTGVLELSRRLRVARATVQSRLDRLLAGGVIERFAPRLNTAAMGYDVTAFTTLEIRQGHDREVVAHLSAVPEVLEVHTITGQGDLHCRIVGRSNADLQRVLDRTLRHPGVVRASTIIALTTVIPFRIEPLVEQVGRPPDYRTPS